MLSLTGVHKNLGRAEILFEYIRYEPFGLGRFATDRCYAPQVNGRYAALLPTNFYFFS